MTVIKHNMSLYQVGARGQLIVNAQSAEPYLNRLLGQDFYKKRSDAVALGIEKPKDYLLARQHELDIGVEHAAKEYARAFNKYYEAGFDEEQCKEAALNHAKNKWSNEKAYVNLSFPEQIADGLLKSNTDGRIGVNEVWNAGAIKGATEHKKVTSRKNKPKRLDEKK